MRLKEFMSSPVVTVKPGDAADTAWSRMQEERVRHLVVMEDSRLVGVLSGRDLGGPNGAEVRKGRTVDELMTSPATSATPDMTLRRAANLMRGRLIGSVPVVEDDQVVGIVTATDVLDELGRGSTRPDTTARRRGMRVPPAGARASARREWKPPPQPAVRRGDQVKVQNNIEGPQKPVFIRAVGTKLSREDRDYIRQRLAKRLHKFDEYIERISVRVEDINGPRGGVDKRCRVKVVLSGLPSIVVDERHYAARAAIDLAFDRVEQSISRAVERQRSTGS